MVLLRFLPVRNRVYQMLVFCGYSKILVFQCGFQEQETNVFSQQTAAVSLTPMVLDITYSGHVCQVTHLQDVLGLSCSAVQRPAGLRLEQSVQETSPLRGSQRYGSEACIPCSLCVEGRTCSCTCLVLFFPRPGVPRPK